MAYAAWSVVFGEQPSAAKWNILGTNDSTFNTLLGTYGVANPYCFRAYDSGGTTLTDGIDVKINLATENYDYNNNFATSTYTAPINGVYHFDGCVVSSALTAGVRAFASIRKNGSTAIYGVQMTPVNSGLICTVSGDLLLAATNTIDLYCLQDTAGNETTTTGDTTTWMSGHLVHAT